VGKIVIRRSSGYWDKGTVQIQKGDGRQVAEEKMSNT